jgi:hypothetical protein
MVVVNCEQVWREVSNYIDGEADAGLRLAMEEHFQTCARCRTVLEGARNVVRLYGDERMLEVPAGFSGRLQKKLARLEQGSSGWSVWSAWLVPVAALVLVAGGLELSSHPLNRTHELKSEHAQPGKRIPPDMPVVVSEGAKLFHVAGCEFIHNRSTARTLTAKEAMEEGYVPCARCLRKYLNTAAAAQTGVVSIGDIASQEEEQHGPGD